MKRSIKLIAVMLICLSLNSIVPSASAKSLKGDIDGDGKITFLDVQKVLRFSATQDVPTASQKKLADMNGNGQITLYDVKKLMAQTIGADLYEESLLRKGFPASYVDYLSELHEKYPNWEFEPFITNLDWADAVEGEHTPHDKQLIENTVQDSYMCSCSSCKGVIQEGSVWVSASKKAIEYYLDPRNFLSEEYIFQFESTAYNKSQTQSGVEAILKNTWMYDSNITYLNGSGNKKTYKENGKPVKYSAAILKAAKDSGMSAYYLASKIVQEVGSSTASYAGGSSGEFAPFYGIYNYYNIGAYTGVRDGLEWANGFMKTTEKVSMRKTASTSSGKVVTVPANAELAYIGKSGSFYKTRAVIKGKTYTGYVPKSSVSIYTTYNRPWTTPQKTIYNGAQYIYDSFSQYQFTGYLQKFNVNPDSGSLYYHEYMANVRAAASEAFSTYKAYTSAGILKTKKVFSIPVFNNMPNADFTMDDFFKLSKTKIAVSEYTPTAVTISWSKLDRADNYQVYRYDSSTKEYKRIKTTSDLTYTDSSLSSGKSAKYKVRGYLINKRGKRVYSSFSDVFEASVKPARPTGVELVSKGKTYAELKWNKVNCTKYQIYRYDSVLGKYKKVGTTTSPTFKDDTVERGSTYKYKIRAYKKTSSKVFYSSYSPAFSVTTKGTATKLGVVKTSSDVLNVRAKASKDSAVIHQLSNGQRVRVLDTLDNWCKISFIKDNKIVSGYVSSKYLTIYDETTVVKDVCPYTEPKSTVQEGDSGESVKWVQWHLYKLKYLEKSDIDGDFGPTTFGAVKKFQADNKLDDDGVVGSGTRNTLKTAYGA